MAKIIAIANQKGGVGKTTSALAIASCLKREYKKKVLVIDFDPQRNISQSMKLENKNTIVDVFEEICTIKESIQTLPLFDVIPGDERLTNADKLYDDRDDIFLLADVCDVLKTAYDYIIIDNTPARNTCLNMTYVAADHVVVPSDDSSYSLEGMIAIENDINKLRNSRDKVSHAKIIGFILTSYQKCQVCDSVMEQLEKIAETLDGDIFVDKTRKSVKVSEAPFLGQTIIEYSPNCNPSRDYSRITKKIIERVSNG